MTYERQFAATATETMMALERAVRHFEKFRSADQALLTIDFDTRMSGWSWGSRWRIEVRSIGDGCVATADIVGAGSLVAGTSEAKKITSIFDLAESLASTASAPAGGDVPVTARALEAMVPPDLPAKHQRLIGPILQALAEAETAASTQDIVDEELAIARAQRTAGSAGMFAVGPAQWCEEEIRARIAAGLLRIGAQPVARVGADLMIMSDRILQASIVRALDEHVTAMVEVGGQILQSTGPTLAGVAAAADRRTASFIVVHPSWRLVEPIDPDDAHEVSAIAAQVTAMAAQMRTAPSAPAPPSVPSVTEELTKLAALKDAGALTDEEFAAAKARLLDL